MNRINQLIQSCPDPVAAQLRMERLLQLDGIQQRLESLTEPRLADFIHMMSVSHFLYRYLCREPEAIGFLDLSLDREGIEIRRIDNLQALRKYKYQQLMLITWQDMTDSVPYKEILTALSLLADNIINKVLALSIEAADYEKKQQMQLSVFAMGKLGASELNYSSDIDLIFLSADDGDVVVDKNDYHGFLTYVIRHFIGSMEEITQHGHLYRVDLNLRPWGRSGPLFLSIEDTEHYYEASTEAWERFAWLRARNIAGDKYLGKELLERLQPFIYQQSLSSDDLDRFLMIKQKMAEKRRKTGSWNVKVGEGGIRDIEFFIQLLQIVNAYHHPVLKETNTMNVLSGLIKTGFLGEDEGMEIEQAYLFLRRLENRLQMFDEKQTHELPDEPELRLKIARSLGFIADSDEHVLDDFETCLINTRAIAKGCFNRILPEKTV